MRNSDVLQANFTEEQELELHNLAFTSMIITIVEMSYLTIALLIMLVRVYKIMNFKFLIRLIVLLLITDVANLI